jgi:FtsP/CotA-like multicopper oxidase with cupredoxin domain
MNSNYSDSPVLPNDIEDNTNDRESQPEYTRVALIQNSSSGFGKKYLPYWASGGVFIFIIVLVIALSVSLKTKEHAKPEALGKVAADDNNLKNPFAAYAYQQMLIIPSIINMTQGGVLDMESTSIDHNWGIAGLPSTKILGYGRVGEVGTYPGPTILARANVSITVNWHNNIEGLHPLNDYVDPSLLYASTECYPTCGVPGVVHLHGQEGPAIYDGLPQYSIGKGQMISDYYLNDQIASTLLYHDHAGGLTRLNIQAGLLGVYIIENPDDDATLGLDFSACDIPLIFSDKTIDAITGSLKYDASCLSNSKWASESYGDTILVNGIVTPYVEIPQQQCRFRFINGANARKFLLKLPFQSQCMIIGTDSGYVKTPVAINAEIPLSSFERLEVVCDFSGDALGTIFNVTTIASDSDDESQRHEILQVRVTSPAINAHVTLPVTLHPIKNLQDLWMAQTAQVVQNISLFEIEDDKGCPTMLQIAGANTNGFIGVSDYMKGGLLSCKKGTVERWDFYNYSPDEHPFHWHQVKAQCGPDDLSINTNNLKDVHVIPPAPGAPMNRTQVCYVACTPGNYLLEGSTTASTGFRFSTKEPYLAHCHILEHEENSMMTGFALVD